jgi:hypothetical protein
MKTTIILNIGLTDKNNSPVELHNATHAVENAGVSILSSSVVAGEWKGKPEQTLVIGGLALASDELTRRIYAASVQLSQHCIAVWHNGLGELIGDNPEGWSFDAELFHFHAREARMEGNCERHKDWLCLLDLADTHDAYGSRIHAAIFRNLTESDVKNKPGVYSWEELTTDIEQVTSDRYVCG